MNISNVESQNSKCQSIRYFPYSHQAQLRYSVNWTYNIRYNVVNNNNDNQCDRIVSDALLFYSQYSEIVTWNFLTTVSLSNHYSLL